MPYLPTVGQISSGFTNTLNYLLKGKTNGNVTCACVYNPNHNWEDYIVSCQVCKKHTLLEDIAREVAIDANVDRLAAAILDFAKDHMHDPALETKTERRFR